MLAVSSGNLLTPTHKHTPIHLLIGRWENTSVPATEQRELSAGKARENFALLLKLRAAATGLACA